MKNSFNTCGVSREEGNEIDFGVFHDGIESRRPSKET
jgi:hypothetical protein